jgi:hypothetical protein
MRVIPLILFLLSSSTYAWLTPSQIHLSWTEREDEMRVTWSVFPTSISSSLKYREVDCPDPHSSWKTVKADEKYFKHGSLLFQYIYVLTAVIPNLRPECYYEYKVGNSAFWSETFKFSGITPYYKFPNRQESLDLIAQLAVFGDLGVGNWSAPTRDMLRDDLIETNYHAFIHLGDLGYDLDSEGGYIGNLFGRLIQEYAAYRPYMTIPGNHESAKNFTHYSNRFIMPKNWASQNTSFYYSFNLGRAHFIMYDPELFKYDKKPQMQRMIDWLTEDLKEANLHREEVPWVIAMSHKPLYCGIDTRFPDDDKDNSNNNNCIGQAIQTRSWVEDLFYNNKVDIILGAHVHNYERETAIYQNKSMPCKVNEIHHQHDCTAPIFILSGTAGNDHAHEQITATPQEWNLFGSEAYGYGKLVVYNKTHVYWEQYDTEKREVLDYVWITKDFITY